MPLRQTVPHEVIKNTKWKFRMTDKYTHGLRKLSIEKPFEHCITRTGQSVRSPVFSGNNTSLTFYKDYSWDGASGPAIDTKNTRRASLVHDGLYQAMRLKRLPRHLKEAADAEMMLILEEDGMGWIRRLLWRVGLLFAGRATNPGPGEQYYQCP